LIGPLWGVLRLFRVVLRLSGTKNFFKIGQIFFPKSYMTLYYLLIIDLFKIQSINSGRDGFMGSLIQDFRLQVFFMNQCPPGPQVFHWSLFEFFSKIPRRYLRINVYHRFSCLAVSTTQAKNLSPVSSLPRSFSDRWSH
jgi:hypothetical protein